MFPRFTLFLPPLIIFWHFFAATAAACLLFFRLHLIHALGKFFPNTFLDFAVFLCELHLFCCFLWCFLTFYPIVNKEAFLFLLLWLSTFSIYHEDWNGEKNCYYFFCLLLFKTISHIKNPLDIFQAWQSAVHYAFLALNPEFVKKNPQNIHPCKICDAQCPKMCTYLHLHSVLNPCCIPVKIPPKSSSKYFTWYRNTLVKLLVVV